MRKSIVCFSLGLIVIFMACNPNTSNKTKQEGITNNQEKSTQAYEIAKLAGDFIFTEGPASDAQGNVYFTDLRQNMILVWTINEQLDTFRINTGSANGLYFDNDENLLICEGDKGQITSISPSGDYQIIASSYNSLRFNQPNDIWPDSKGGIYFTDPFYGKNENDLSQDGMHVYYIHPNQTSVVRVCDDLEKPNGLIGSPDGKRLYVTDAQAGKTYKYNIKEDGTLDNKLLFVEYGCDGMTVDTAGNVYFTSRGKQIVDIFSPFGELLDSIPVPERPSNVCFGGRNNNQLYITARTSIYRVNLKTQGVD